MNIDIARKWAAALRSGEYTQGRNLLAAGDGHCCLGVLCELAVREGVVGRAVIPGDDVVSYGGCSRLLPPEVRDWAGMRDCAGERAGGAAPSLYELNDNGMAFSEIARVIEDEATDL